ncbi:GNAT family N-acetyltransferase (plasmid) [Legionella sp. D16C41]|uniref:GNAT family N-acetyltransferase n=1 Tax=Legionella sp. D16C41 TaxID=3402688 RepID=UPI003AF80F65
MLNWKVLTFEECSKNQLYDFLRLRNCVFIVEQKSSYIDLDNWDQKAIHFLGYEYNTLVAYSRLLPPGLKSNEAILSRVCSAPTHRHCGVGLQMLKLRLDYLKQFYPDCIARTSLQAHRQALYESVGFTAISKRYLDIERDIWHIDMAINLSTTTPNFSKIENPFVIKLSEKIVL